MTTSSTLSPRDIVAHVGRELGAWLQKGRGPATAHPYVYASAWRPCERRMTYELTVPDQQPPLDAYILAKMRRGNDRERDLLADLKRVGRDAEPVFDIIGQQERFELKGRSGKPVIVGKVDGRLKIESLSAPIEVKSWAQTLTDRIETFDDAYENPYTRPGSMQLLSYLTGSNTPVGFLILDKSGLPALIPVELDAMNLDRMEEFLSRAERVVAHRDAGTLPPFIDDPSECKRCGFYGSPCQPPVVSKAAAVLTDPELESHLEQWHNLRGPGREFEALDRDLKRHLRGVESAVIGHFVINGRWSKSSRVDLPADLKKQYTVTDPKGRFTLDIERV